MIKLQDLPSLFSSSKRAELAAKQRAEDAQAAAAKEINRAGADRMTLEQYANFLRRLDSWQGQLGELQKLLAPAQVETNYRKALATAITISFGGVSRNPLMSDEVIKARAERDTASDMLEEAEAFVGTLEAEIEQFVSVNQEVLKRHGARF